MVHAGEPYAHPNLRIHTYLTPLGALPVPDATYFVNRWRKAAGGAGAK
jgi:hypothetical protein